MMMFLLVNQNKKRHQKLNVKVNKENRAIVIPHSLKNDIHHNFVKIKR